MVSKLLIIYAHPNKNGFCGEVLNQILKNVKKCEILDLYSLKFNAILSNVELNAKGNKKSEEILKIQEKIRTSKLIFIYPTWWQNMPAILKGFVDRVFSHNFAYKYVGNMPKGLLSGKAIAITTCGAPKFYFTLFKGGRALKVLTKDSLDFCGLKTKGFVIGSARELNDEKKKEIDKVVKKALKWLD